MAKKKTITEPIESFVYMGPSIRGYVQAGTIFTGTRSEVMEFNRIAIDNFPDVARLIVRADEISTVKNKIKSGGNSYSNAYKNLLTK
ncbi:MAG: hypothetical protein ACI4OB_07005 [Christensenellales bacterium]